MLDGRYLVTSLPLTSLPVPFTLAAGTETSVIRLTVDQVLSPYVYVFMAAFIVAFLFTPIMRAVASYHGIVDKPDGARKLHREPVAYLGGVAVFLGWLTGLTLTRFLVMHRWPGAEGPNLAPHIPFSVAAAGIVIVLLGLIDDTKGVKPLMKIGGQIFAALLLIFQGIGTNSLRPMLSTLDERIQVWAGIVPIQPHLVYVPEWVVLGASVAFVIALVVFCCNATNLMDGMDGLCGGVTAIIALGYVFLAVHVAQGGTGNTNTDAVRIVIALALLGGVMGFVPYNFNPASIFMGDTGSMFLGFTIATSMLMLGEAASKWLLASLVMFALPTLDTALAFVRRYIAGRPFFSADKHHIHHQFLARGLSVKQTVLFLYGSAIFFVLLGASVALMRTRYSVCMYLVVFGCIIVAAYKMGMVHEKVKTADKPNPIGPDDKIVQGPTNEGVLQLPDQPSVSLSSEQATGVGKTPLAAGTAAVR